MLRCTINSPRPNRTRRVRVCETVIAVPRFDAVKTETRSQIRVVLTDDHAVAREGIEFLEQDVEIRVVAEAGDSAAGRM